jgi:hypothetical protein
MPGKVVKKRGQQRQRTVAGRCVSLCYGKEHADGQSVSQSIEGLGHPLKHREVHVCVCMNWDGTGPSYVVQGILIAERAQALVAFDVEERDAAHGS